MEDNFKIKTKTVKEILPLNVNEIYDTKFVNETVLITSIDYNKKTDKIINIFGIYQQRQHLGVCLINENIIIKKQKPIYTIDVKIGFHECPNCHKTIEIELD